MMRRRTHPERVPQLDPVTRLAVAWAAGRQRRARRGKDGVDLRKALAGSNNPYERAVVLVSLRSPRGGLNRRERLIVRARFIDNVLQRQIDAGQMHVARLMSEGYQRLARGEFEGRRR